MDAVVRPENKYTPFDGEILITLLDEDAEPLAISDYDDVEVYVFLNGALKLKFKSVAFEDEWKAWTDAEAEDANQINCPLTVQETDGWRGLVNTATVLIKDELRGEPIIKVQYIAVKSGVSAPEEEEV